jgi:hypothetical protein
VKRRESVNEIDKEVNYDFLDNYKKQKKSPVEEVLDERELHRRQELSLLNFDRPNLLERAEYELELLNSSDELTF